MSWGKGIILVFVIFILGIGIMVYKSMTKNIDLVTSNYYEKELKYQEQIDKINNSNRLEEKLKHIEIENTRLTGLSDLYKTNIGRLEKEKREILKKTKSDAEDFLKTVNKKVETAIKEIRESGAQKNVIKETKKIIDELKAEAQNLYSPEVVTEINISDFRVGNFVMIRETSTQGRILQIDSARNKALIESGSIKMQVNLSELVIANASKETKAENHHHNLQNIIPQHRLDIRGRKPEEVDFEIIKFLDDSYMNGQDRIEILHGKGTGALKKTVRDILDKHEKVKNYYFAPIEFGGEGITIVELK